MKNLLYLFFCILLLSCADAKFRDKNYDNVETKSLFKLIQWKLTSQAQKWPNKVEQNTFKPLESSENLSLGFIGHASVLIQIDGVNILTDPIYSERASPFSFIGPKRVRRPSIKFEDLPNIDLVLISHNHYDHLDIDTLKDISKKFPRAKVLLGLENGKLLDKHNINNYKEMDWWEKYQYKNITLTFTPSKHWSARGLWDRFETLWGSFAIKTNDKHIYFAGDTGYGKHFKLIRDRLGEFDVAILPIGAYEPRWFMQDFHINPSEAIRAMIDLEASRSFAIHFDTFPLADEAFGQASKDLEIARLDYKNNSKKNIDFIVPDFSQYYQLK